MNQKNPVLIKNPRIYLDKFTHSKANNFEEVENNLENIV
jgi:hypothetical protein